MHTEYANIAKAADTLRLVVNPRSGIVIRAPAFNQSSEMPAISLPTTKAYFAPISGAKLGSSRAALLSGQTAART